MKKKAVLIVIVAVVVMASIYYWQGKSADPLLVNKETTHEDLSQSETTTQSITKISQYKYTEKYSHPTNRFSFNYPKGFTVTLIPNDGVDTIVVQSITTKVAMQIMISPFKGNDIDITKDVIKIDIPDMKIDSAQEITVGPSRKGLFFISNSPAFGGKSSEIWFVFKRNLYQISTYYEFNDFLKEIFTTWKFE